jgi:hypothetical protein
MILELKTLTVGRRQGTFNYLRAALEPCRQAEEQSRLHHYWQYYSYLRDMGCIVWQA